MSRHGAFENLPAERQKDVMEAALKVFGNSDYKGASTDEIARRAGFSKGLLFFYFRNKRELYLRVMDYLYDKVVALMIDDGFWEIDDFFEIMFYAADKKLAIMQKMPWAISFSIRAFYPQHRDIKDSAYSWTQAQIDVMFRRFFKNVDFSRFRDEVDPRYVLNMIIWLADGWMHQHQVRQKPIDFNEMMGEYRMWCEMIRAWAYKEEYQ